MTRQVIINFHGIGSPGPEIDGGERPYWISEDCFRQIVDLVAVRPDRDRIVITFDDGNASDATIGVPALRARGLKGQFFVLADRIDRPGYLSTAQIREMVAEGMGIGLHGAAHRDWRGLDAVALDGETRIARETVERAAGQAVSSVAIPFGAYNARVIRKLQREGFARIYTSDGGDTHEYARIAARTSIRGDMTLDRVTAILDNREAMTRRVRRRLSMLVRRHLA